MSTPSKVVFRTGKRIYLRPLSREDVPNLTVWINNPEVHQFLTVRKPMLLEQEQAWFDGLKDKDNQVIFAIVLKEDDQFIGVMGLHNIDNVNGTAVTGSFIGLKEHWSKGYGTEAKMLVLDFAFNALNLRKICSVVFGFNGRSKRALEKSGYKVEGIRKKQVFKAGKYCDEFQLAVFKKDFLPLWRKFKKDLV